MSSESSDATVDCSSYPPAATRAYVVNEELRPSDVLFGRGVNIDSYSGNVAFRKTVAPSKSSYKATRRQERKRLLAQGIIDSVHRNNGRFLRLLAEDEAKDLSVPSFYNMVWVVAEHNMVLEKVKGALRGNSYVRKGPVTQMFDTISSDDSFAHTSMPAMDGTQHNAIGGTAAIDWRPYYWRHPFVDRHYHVNSFAAVYPPHWAVSPPPYNISHVEQQFCNHGFATSAHVDPPWLDNSSAMCGKTSAVDSPAQPPFVYDTKVPPTPRPEALTDIEHSAISQAEADRQQAEMRRGWDADQRFEFETLTRPNEHHLHSQLPSFSPLQRPPSSPPYAAERPPYE